MAFKVIDGLQLPATRLTEQLLGLRLLLLVQMLLGIDMIVVAATRRRSDLADFAEKHLNLLLGRLALESFALEAITAFVLARALDRALDTWSRRRADAIGWRRAGGSRDGGGRAAEAGDRGQVGNVLDPNVGAGGHSGHTGTDTELRLLNDDLAHLGGTRGHGQQASRGDDDDGLGRGRGRGRRHCTRQWWPR